ncbi:MAG: hypothetical protein ACFUZC_01640 [Chthoniobacteraceae bacterium]
MTSFWLNTALTIVVSTLVLVAIAAAAARIRFSASCGVRWVLDVIFLLPLILPLQAIPVNSTSDMFRNLMLIEAGNMLPILYLAAIAGFRNVSREVLESARLQGMGSCGTFWHFFVPAGREWLLGGAALVVIRLLVVTGILARNGYCA